MIISYTGATATKANNEDDLNLTSSWVDDSPPTSAGIAKWDSTVTSANTTILGADLTWGSINIADPDGLVTINAGNTLTLAGGIDMSAATADLTLNCDIAAGGPTTWDVATDRTLSLAGMISGDFNINKQGGGTAVISGGNTYSGTTAVNAGTLQLAASDAIPNGASAGNISVGPSGMLDLNGFSDTINGLLGNGIMDNTAADTTSTLTVGGNNTTSTFGGVMRNSASASTLNLVKIGGGQFTLAGPTTFSGSVTVNSGNLTLGNANSLANISGLTIGAAQLGLSANVVISAPITLSDDVTLIAQNGAMLLTSLNGTIDGTGNLTFTTVANSLSGADSKVLLGGADGSFDGNVMITSARDVNNMTVRIGAENALPASAVVTLGTATGSGAGNWCDLDLFGNNQQLAGLTNTAGTNRLQRVYNSGETAVILTINNAADYSFGGRLGKVDGDNLSLIKSGEGVLTLSGINTYSGNTTVSEGTLSLGTINANNESSTVTIGDTGVLELTFDGTDTVGKLVTGVTEQAGGTYGHTDSGADNGGQGVGALDAYFGPGTGTLTVAAEVLGYSGWASLNGAGPNLDDDHDNDGVDNGVEYFLGGPNGNTTGFTPLPAVTDTGGTLSVTWTHAADYTGTYGSDFVVEISATLDNPWTTETAGGNVTIDGNNVTYTFPAGTKNFARLKVTGP